MGSAIKGIEFIPNPEDHREVDASISYRIVCVGYDQRLSVWNLAIKKNVYTVRENVTHPKNTHFLEAASVKPGETGKFSSGVQLDWLTGRIINIGDIQGLHLPKDAGNNGVAVVFGEGTQLVELSI